MYCYHVPFHTVHGNTYNLQSTRMDALQISAKVFHRVDQFLDFIVTYVLCRDLRTTRRIENLIVSRVGS